MSTHEILGHLEEIGAIQISPTLIPYAHHVRVQGVTRTRGIFHAFERQVGVRRARCNLNLDARQSQLSLDQSRTRNMDAVKIKPAAHSL
jgi:hypothetical protein